MKAQDILDKQLGEPVWSLIQRGLAGLGYYRGTYAGRPGEKTLEALDRYLAIDAPEPASGAVASSAAESFGSIIATIALEEAAKEIRESGGNNRGPDIVRYQEATWLPPGAWPWCQAFVAWVIREAIQRGGPVRFTRPRTAGAWDMENWATDRDQQTGSSRRRSGGAAAGVSLIKPAEAAEARAGDIIVFNYSHIGIVVRDGLVSGRIRTVEGNTSGSGADREGDGVHAKTVEPRHLRSLIRLTR